MISNDGSELIATYGERGVPGDDATHYGSPQDVAFMPDGRILVADGLLNNRVIVYDSEMNYLGEFGSKGMVPVNLIRYIPLPLAQKAEFL